MPRVDLHLHSSGSRDCRVDPVELVTRLRSLGLGPVFLTDHDNIQVASALARRHPGLIEVGEEISTAQGEIVGLFLSEVVPPGLSAVKTADRIKSQGGLIYLQHPYDLNRNRLDEAAIEVIAPLVDIVEVHNGRASSTANERAQELCEILDAAPGAGSDAHSLAAIGSVYIQMPDFDGPQTLLKSLRAGRILEDPSELRMRLSAHVRRLSKSRPFPKRHG